MCGSVGEPTLVCEACERSLSRAMPHPACIAPYAYRYPVDRLVQRFKFAGDLAAGRWLGERLADRVREEPRPDLLVTPPLATHRLRERGFNQAHELAKTVGRALDLPVARRGLSRRRQTTPQPGLGRLARRANLAGAFECRLDLRGRRVAIVDDVLTTGATADALGEALRQCGASAVEVWVVARTPDPGT